MPFERRTFATLRKAEFGFLGVMVFTCVTTPRLKGEEKRTCLFFNLLNAKVKAGACALRSDDFLFRLIN